MIGPRLNQFSAVAISSDCAGPPPVDVGACPVSARYCTYAAWLDSSAPSNGGVAMHHATPSRAVRTSSTASGRGVDRTVATARLAAARALRRTAVIGP